MSRSKRKNNLDLDNLIKDYQGNPQSIPLYVLATLSAEKEDLFREIINSEFAGNEKIFGRRLLSSRNLKNAYFKIQISKKALEDFYEKKHLLWAEKYQKFLEAKKDFDDLKKELIKIKVKINQYDASSKALLKEIQKVSRASAKSEVFVLVHRTATIKQLKEFQKMQMVVTEVDATYQYIIVIADEIFDKDVNFIALPHNMSGRELTFEEKSAIAFVNMMFYHKVKNIKFEAIFSDKTISDLLKYNKYYS